MYSPHPVCEHALLRFGHCTAVPTACYSVDSNRCNTAFWCMLLVYVTRNGSAAPVMITQTVRWSCVHGLLTVVGDRGVPDPRPGYANQKAVDL